MVRVCDMCVSMVHLYFCCLCVCLCRVHFVAWECKMCVVTQSNYHKYNYIHDALQRVSSMVLLQWAVNELQYCKSIKIHLKVKSSRNISLSCRQCLRKKVYFMGVWYYQMYGMTFKLTSTYNMSGSRIRDLIWHNPKNWVFYAISKLHWRLNWAVFSKAVTNKNLCEFFLAFVASHSLSCWNPWLLYWM